MKSNLRVKNRSIFNMPDNREVVITAGEMREQFEIEFNRRADDLFKAVQKDVTAQLMATIMTVLHQEFGFGRKRLRRVKRGTEALFRGMLQNGIFGKKFDTQTCIDYMREKFGVDVEKEEA